MDIRAIIQKELDSLPSAGHTPAIQQGGLTIPILRIHISAVLEKDLDSLESVGSLVASAHCKHEGSLATVFHCRRHVDVCAVVDKDFYRLEVAHACLHEGSSADNSGRIDLSAVVEEEFDYR